MTRYIAVAALVIAKNAEGAMVNTYMNDIIPKNIPETEITRLAEQGFIRAVPERATKTKENTNA